MKNITTIICFFISLISFAQNSVSDKDMFLSEKEVEHLNNSFETSRNDFDFQNKKIGFISGNNGKTKTNKDDYFIFANSSEQKGSLIIFNDQEKIYSGGYDAVIVYWSKVLQKRMTIIKILKNKR